VILLPIIVNWRSIAAATALQKRVGNRPHGGGLSVGWVALAIGGFVGPEHIARRCHIRVGLPSFARAFFCNVPRGFVGVAEPKGGPKSQSVDGAKANHGDNHARNDLGVCSRRAYVFSRERIAP
jgi:hypothetical protein